MSDELIEVKHEARLELDQERVMFVMADGTTKSIVLSNVLGKGDYLAALQYANLIVLKNVVEKQDQLAKAMTAMAQALRAINSPPANPGGMMSPGAVNEVVDKIFTRVTDLMGAAGININRG